MLGYESPTRRGDGFLTEPEPQFVNMPVHTGKWMSELYAEQGLDLFSGGAAGFGVVKGEVQKGSGGASGGANPGYDGNSGYGNSNMYQENNSGYGSSDISGYSSTNNGYENNNNFDNDNNDQYGYGGYSSPQQANNNGYGSNNYGGYQNGGGSFDRFGPPQGY
jgi:hypothetical protein